MNSRRRLVHMIHINPRSVVFESSHEVFVVPLHDQGGLVAGDATSSLPESVPHPSYANAGYLYFSFTRDVKVGRMVENVVLDLVLGATLEMWY